MTYPKNFPGQLGSFIKSGTFVHMIFCEYYIILCLFYLQSYFEKLSLVQKNIVKVMNFNKQTASSTLIFSYLEVLKTDDIRQFQLLSFAYNC